MKDRLEDQVHTQDLGTEINLCFTGVKYLTLFCYMAGGQILSFGVLTGDGNGTEKRKILLYLQQLLLKYSIKN
jgi:hypothetical protein